MKIPLLALAMMVFVGSLSPVASADTHTTRCDRSPYGSTTAAVHALKELEKQRMEQAFQNAGASLSPQVERDLDRAAFNVASGFSADACRAKDKSDGARTGLYGAGLTDRQIDQSSVEQLARLIWKASEHPEPPSPPLAQPEASPPGLYAPITCARGFCSGPADPAYVYSSLQACKRYLAVLRLPYLHQGAPPPGHGSYGFCAYHAPEWVPATE